ncbi:TetR/AcrR family transcriptional regulator [Actinoplanes sp. NPDC049265]|uniref:TetR/AcrR family transcriptional regulator n=1 Tax=Actinoplanes sp. NPDC049265 TaxID=3363902 RepID=UPI003713F17B
MTRRVDALSRERIVGAAVEMLDESGESGLTVRALAARLNTGLGAIYWHVTNKDDLLVAATDAVLTGALDTAAADPADTVRAVALGVFDAVDAHPWTGTQLPRLTSQLTTLKIFERLGRQVRALGVPAAAQFDAASALLNYILGVAGQNAALARSVAPGTDRATVLRSMSATWAALDQDEHSFARTVAGRLADHDDRAQFLAGIDLILAGIRALVPAPAPSP